jgi:hypothetical protein
VLLAALTVALVAAGAAGYRAGALAERRRRDRAEGAKRAARRDEAVAEHVARHTHTVSLEERVLAERVAEALGDVETRLAAFTDGPHRTGPDT